MINVYKTARDKLIGIFNACYVIGCKLKFIRFFKKSKKLKFWSRLIPSYIDL